MPEKTTPKTAPKNGVTLSNFVTAVPPSEMIETKRPRKKRVDHVRPPGVPLLTKPELTRLFLDWDASCEKIAKLEATRKKEEEARAVIVQKIIDGSEKKSFVWRRRILTGISRLNERGQSAWYLRETTKDHEMLED